MIDLGTVSYLGVPLLSSDKRIIGHLVIFDDKPMPKDALVLKVMETFSARAGVELEREQALRELQRQKESISDQLRQATAALAISEEKFRDLFDEAPIAYVHEGLDTRFIISATPREPHTIQEVEAAVYEELDRLKVIVNVLEKDIPKITRGKEATITVDAFPDRQFTGRVARYSDAVDPGTRTMAVEIDINNRGHALKPGMFANVSLALEQHPDAVTVPAAAVQKDDRGTFVYTVASDSARRIDVKTGLELEGCTEILAGLDPRTPIITTGQQFVRDRGPVSVDGR